jgi:hypothetical protein
MISPPNARSMFQKKKTPMGGVSFLVATLQVIDFIGGPDRDRTDDLFHAMEARSQLRHRPTLGEGLYLFWMSERF